MKESIELTTEEHFAREKEIQDDFFKDANYISEKIKLFSEKFNNVDYSISSMIISTFRIRITFSGDDYANKPNEFDELSDEIQKLSISFFQKWGNTIGEVVFSYKRSYLKVIFVLNSILIKEIVLKEITSFTN